MFRFSLVLILLGGPSFSLKAGETGQEPLAVLALVSGEGEREASELAAVVQEKLHGRVAALATGKLIERLGGAGALTGDIEKLRGIYQQAYLQSYSFKYDAAVKNLEQVLEGLKSVPDTQARWDLWVQANVYLGKSLAGKGDRQAARAAFVRALRVRHKMELTRREHSPKTIALWEEARDALKTLPSGRITVDAEPRVSDIYLDGVKVGQTPLATSLIYGRYLMKVENESAGAAYRWVEIGQQDAKVALNLAFEGAIELDLVHPAVRIPRGRQSLPRHWWAWLSERLGVSKIVVVRKSVVDNRPRCHAALVDGLSGRVLREGWLESSGREKEHLAVDSIELSDFMATGKAGKRVVQTVPDEAKPPRDKPEAPPVRKIGPRPFYRKWWPASLLGSAFIGGGAVALAISLDYSEAGGLKDRQSAADTWMGVAVAGFAVGAAIIVTGIISDVTFDPGQDPQVTITPLVSPGECGVRLLGRF